MGNLVVHHTEDIFYRKYPLDHDSPYLDLDMYVKVVHKSFGPIIVKDMGSSRGCDIDRTVIVRFWNISADLEF